MKKTILLLLVLLLAVPGFANVVITVDANSDDNTFTVGYNASTEPNRVRAFALNIDVNNGATIDAITAAKVGESNSVSQGYGIFMGSIVISGDTVTSYGDPVAPIGDPNAAGELGDASITIELGSLYEDSNYAPADTGDLFTITVSGDCCITVSEEPRRGGVVMENPDESPTVDLPGTTCLGSGPTCVCVDPSTSIDRCNIDICDSSFFGPPDNQINFADLGLVLYFYDVASSACAGLGEPYTSACLATDICDTSFFGAPDGMTDFADLGLVLYFYDQTACQP